MVLGRAWRGGGAGPLPASIARAGVAGSGDEVAEPSAPAAACDDGAPLVNGNGGKLPGVDPLADERLAGISGGASSSTAPGQSRRQRSERPSDFARPFFGCGERA
eukprot:gb/GFBE01079557.1/.p1 GENE.gb/GFBE01079557.1/~~gb/GFBE01079557.1/.p1  ORF type:complete len:105 (+),score=14.12 gb/GFBE01079557.1/:1-315(+)